MKAAIYHRIANKNETSQNEMQKQIEALSNIAHKNNFEMELDFYIHLDWIRIPPFPLFQ